MRTLDKLAEIPSLAALVAMSADAPHRSAAVRSGARTGSPMPPQVTAWDLLRSDAAWAPIGVLIEACLTVHDDMVDDPRRPDMPSPTFDATCAWLADPIVVAYWRSDDVLSDWVASAASQAYISLSSWMGDHHEKLVCRHCRGRLEVIEAGEHGEHEVICSDCRHVWTSAEVAHLAMMLTPATLPEIAAMLDVTERTARRWARAFSIEPVSTHAESPRRPALYLPSDFEGAKKVRAA